MKWQIAISKNALKFIEKNNVEERQIISAIGKGIDKLKGEDINIDIKKLRGDWEGFFRIRMGKIRLLLSIDFEHNEIYVDRIDFRGNVYI